MELPQLQTEQLSLLDLIEQTSVDGPEFYAASNTQSNTSLVERDANLGSAWLNVPSLGFNHTMPQDQSDMMFSDTESLTSCGSAVASPAVFDNTEQISHFNFLQDNELKHLSVKDLNLKLKGQSKDVVRVVKKRRRTLKNRGYAHSCRIKRIEEKSKLQRTKAQQESFIAELQQQLTATENEKDLYKSRYEALVRHIMAMQNMKA